MHNFVYLAQRRSEEFSREPNFGGGGRGRPLAAPVNGPIREYKTMLLFTAEA